MRPFGGKSSDIFSENASRVESKKKHTPRAYTKLVKKYEISKCESLVMFCVLLHGNMQG